MQCHYYEKNLSLLFLPYPNHLRVLLASLPAAAATAAAPPTPPRAPTFAAVQVRQ
jgi:hypothetical protein